jgi:hypothetical protein
MLMPECCCPYCGHKFDRVSGITEERQPRPGDLTLCIQCSLVMAFADDLRVRALNAEELEYLLTEPGFKEVIARTAAAIRHVQAAKN